MGKGQNSSMHHNNNVPAIVRGVVGGLFVADTIIALILIYVFFFWSYKHSTRLGGGLDVWVYLS
jgi:hypothetical protein